MGAFAELPSSIVQSLFVLAGLVLSLFPVFVHKPIRVTIPVCVISCDYSCCCFSVPSLTSTCCSVRTIAVSQTAKYRHRFDPVSPFLSPLTSSEVFPSSIFDPLRLSCLGKVECVHKQRQNTPASFSISLRGMWKYFPTTEKPIIYYHMGVMTFNICKRYLLTLTTYFLFF